MRNMAVGGPAIEQQRTLNNEAGRTGGISTDPPLTRPTWREARRAEAVISQPGPLCQVTRHPFRPSAGDGVFCFREGAVNE